MPLPDAYMPPESSGPEISERSRGVALALGFFGGFFGLHRFYVGKTGSGVAMIVTLGGLGFWGLYDRGPRPPGDNRDIEAPPRLRWPGEAARPGGGGRSDQRVELVEQELQQLRDQFNDLAERVDFAERMLAQHRDRPQLPRG